MRNKTNIAERRLDFVDVAQFFVHAIFTRCSDFDVVTEDDRVCHQTFRFQSLTIVDQSHNDKQQEINDS